MSMLDRDSLRLLTIGNLEAMQTDALNERIGLLRAWLRFVQNELDYAEYIVGQRTQRKYDKTGT